MALGQNIYDTLHIEDSIQKKYIIDDILIEGNQKTKERIILRELNFEVGDKLQLDELDAAIEESKKNLLKQPLFNYVTLQKEFLGEDLVLIKIIVEERWFIWPYLAIINNDRNFNAWWQTKDLNKLDYRVAVKQNNVLGLNHIIRIGLSYGYTRELSIYYRNIFLDKKQHHFIGIKGIQFQQKSVFYRTNDNKQESFTSDNDDAITGKKITLEYTFRPKHKSNHTLAISYNDYSVTDSLILLNPGFLANQQSHNSFFQIYYQYILDRRDDRGYPLSGNWFDINLVKTGLGLNTHKVNFFHITGTAKQFYKIAHRFYGAHSVSIRKSFENDQPYYYKQGLGYFEHYLRGYEYYVIDGEDYYLLKNTLKFELLPRRISYLNFIPIKKFKKIHYAFYLNTYFDIGYAHEKNSEILLNNSLSNKLLYSTGLGLDIATYYDKVFRLEYSLNSLGETGIFVHFWVSI